MKSALSFTMIAVLAVMLNTSTSQAQFRHGGNWLGPVLTLATTPIGFGVQYEHGVSENVGIGGIIRYWGRSEDFFYGSVSWSTIIPQFQAAYHFMPGDRLDPYAGGRLGYAIYSSSVEYKGPYSGNDWSDSSAGDIFLTAYGGLRYFFSPKIAGNGQLEFRVAGTDYFSSSIQLSVGVDFTI
ncbi:MAG: outer membrane beta-barrel protein [Bacteroidetes bacterium]|nr:outer membrane beta-barrel protein [Bacteroidota bacterium]